MVKRGSRLAYYRELPKLAGSWRLGAAFFARLPTSMIIIGLLTLVTATTGSVADASIASATLAISTGIGQPTVGRLTDRFGQRRPLLFLLPLHVASLIGVVFLSRAGVHIFWIAVLSGLIGASTAPIGALARVRWYTLAQRPPQLAAALSWESMVDEMAFVIGPAMVGLLSSFVSPFAPLLMCAGISLCFVTVFALSPNAVGPSIPSSATAQPTTPNVARAVATPLIAMLGLGMFFGSMQTSTTAFTEVLGSASQSGLVYASMGLGSAITALGAVILPTTFSLVARIAVGGLGLTVGALLCLSASSPLNLSIFMFLTGLAIGPASVAIFTLTEKLSPQGGEALAVTLLGAMNVLGVAVASPLAGQLLEVNIWYGYILAACSGTIMSVGAVLRSRKPIK